MKLFEINGEKLKSVQLNPFKVEKEIQNIVEKNVDTIFGLEFVKSEITIEGFRIDTLCYDKENNAFVIIEYKKDKNFSVIDQGYTYLSLLINKKAEFILEYNEIKNNTLKRNDLDWSQSRIFFLSPKFTDYQKHSVNFKDVPFELWEIKKYSNNTLGLSRQETKSTESIESLSNEKIGNIVSQVSREVKVYTEEYHLQNPKRKESIRELYQDLKDRILNLGNDIEVVHRKMYIGFKRKTNFFDISPYFTELKCWINLKKGKLDDPKVFGRDVNNTGHHGNGDYEFRVDEKTDLEYLMFLVKQSYDSQG
jgi:predicted transport protein